MQQITFDQLPTVPATAKQRNYIAALMDDMGWHSEQMAVYAGEQGIDLVSMSMAQASGFIDGLKRLAHPTPKQITLIVKVCQDRDCGQSFRASDPDRKYCDGCLAERINGAGIFEDDDEPEESLVERFAAEAYVRDNPHDVALFDEPPPVRQQRRVLVQCRVCGKHAMIPILADAKICDSCLGNLPSQKDRIELELERATDASFNAELDLHTAIADASEKDRQRYQNAAALREASDPRIKDAWAKALQTSDGLAVLLRAYDAQLVAEQALVTALNHGQLALEEIAKVQE